MITRRGLLAGGMGAMLAPGIASGEGDAPRPRPRPSTIAPLSASELIARSSLPGTISFALADPISGQIIQQREGNVPLRPASVLKLVTALYALERLRADHRFRTRIIRTDDMLILAGGGDPVLTTDDLSALAGALVNKVTSGPRRFAVWGGALPKIEEIAPAQADYLAYNPSVSGMILNFNRVHLGWRRSGDGYQMSLEARAARNSPRAYTIEVSPAQQGDVFRYRDSADRRGDRASCQRC